MSQNRQRELSALLQELTDLAANAPARLSQRVAGLSIREQAELALRLPARQRLELLTHRFRTARWLGTRIAKSPNLRDTAERCT